MRYVIFLALVVCSVARADEITIPVMKSSWVVRFEAPPLKKIEERDRNDRFYYVGNNGRLNVSVLIDDPQCPGEITSNASALACFQQSQTRAPFPPVPGSMETVQKQEYALVMYAVRGELQGQRFGQVSAHYVFSYQSKWCQVHISILNPREQEMNIFKDFERTFRYGEN